MTHRKLLQTAAALAADYLDSLPTRAVAPTVAALDSLRALDRPFPERPTDPLAVLRELDARGSPATIASAGGRFFGFVVGGSLPAAVAANVLAAAWDQNAGITVLAPGAAPAGARLVAGVEDADSWALDAHKWLNVPYDSGVAVCRDAAALWRSMAPGPAAYLVHGSTREPDDYTPELSRRARGVEIWAALASLGRTGLADLVERCCRHAACFAPGLGAAGYEVLNDVPLHP